MKVKKKKTNRKNILKTIVAEFLYRNKIMFLKHPKHTLFMIL